MDDPNSTTIDESLFEKIPVLAQEAKRHFRKKILKRLKQYELRKETRRHPTLGFLGPGRAGKDEGAIWLATNFDLEYSGSVSEFVAPLIAHSVGQEEGEIYNSRHKNRRFWFEYCNALRCHDASFLVKMCLAKGDAIAGIRSAMELEACYADGVLDLTIWVDNPRVDIDPTLEFTEDDCDLVVRNAGHKLVYYRRLRKLAGMLGIPTRQPTGEEFTDG